MGLEACKKFLLFRHLCSVAGSGISGYQNESAKHKLQTITDGQNIDLEFFILKGIFRIWVSLLNKIPCLILPEAHGIH